MQLHSTLEKAVTETANVLRGVRPEQFGAPTPCHAWDVRTLTNHLVQVGSALNLAGHRQAVPGDLWGQDLLGDDWAGRFDKDTDEAVAAWADPAAWEGTLNLGGGDMPAPLIATMLASDLVIHGWDLARATGQDYRCDEAAAEMTYRFVADMGEQGQQMGIFAAPQPTPDDASPLDRALALSGRDPGWAAAPW